MNVVRACHVSCLINLNAYYSFVKFYLQLEGGISHLPLLEPSIRAIPLTPSQWRNRLEALNKVNDCSNGDLNGNCILLDVRNGMYCHQKFTFFVEMT